MRLLLALTVVALLAALTVGAGSQQPLVPEPMRVEPVKDNLFVIRGPFNACAPNGCGANGVDDGLLHEAGDVAVRVTPEGVILVDDKFAQNVPEVLEKVRSITAQPIRYLLNSHSHADHIGGDGEILSRGATMNVKTGSEERPDADVTDSNLESPDPALLRHLCNC